MPIMTGKGLTLNGASDMDKVRHGFLCLFTYWLLAMHALLDHYLELKYTLDYIILSYKTHHKANTPKQFWIYRL